MLKTIRLLAITAGLVLATGAANSAGPYPTSNSAGGSSARNTASAKATNPLSSQASRMPVPRCDALYAAPGLSTATSP